ncbi:MAG: hypothetical protein RI907_2400 [Pseudomonadota bacterium]|jgi:hypothetical protein
MTISARQLTALAALALSVPAWATGTVALPADLKVTGSVSIDTANAYAPTGGASQSATLSLTSGGSISSISFSGDPATWQLASLSNHLLSSGDGLGARLTLSATQATAEGRGVFVDYAFNLSNLSSSNTYAIVFNGLINNVVTATGADAYGIADISVRDAANNELLFSDHRVDTVNTGPGNNMNVASEGNAFAVQLAPGQQTSFTALQRTWGGLYAAGNLSNDIQAQLVIDIIAVNGVILQPPVIPPITSTVPLPSTLTLALSGLFTLALMRRRT